VLCFISSNYVGVCTGIAGEVYMNEYGDRNPDYSVLQMDLENDAGLFKVRRLYTVIQLLGMWTELVN